MACFEIRHEAKQQPDERVPQAAIDAAPQPQAWQARLKRLCRHERFSTRIKHDANPVPRSACREKLDFIVIGRCQLYAMQGRLANAATNPRKIDLRCFAREASLSSIAAALHRIHLDDRRLDILRSCRHVNRQRRKTNDPERKRSAGQHRNSHDDCAAYHAAAQQHDIATGPEARAKRAPHKHDPGNRRHRDPHDKHYTSSPIRKEAGNRNPKSPYSDNTRHLQSRTQQHGALGFECFFVGKIQLPIGAFDPRITQNHSCQNSAYATEEQSRQNHRYGARSIRNQSSRADARGRPRIKNTCNGAYRHCPCRGARFT